MRACALILLVAQAVTARTDYATMAGQQGRFCGRVASHRLLPRTTCDSELTLRSETATPLAIVVRASARREFNTRPQDYVGEDLCVTGTIALTNGRPFVEISSPDRLELTRPHTITPGFGASVASVCDRGVTTPTLLRRVVPSYTADAMRAGVDGTVGLEIVVDTDGHVAEARVSTPLDAGLDAEALSAVRQWRFGAGTRDGTPVSVLVFVEMEFHVAKHR